MIILGVSITGTGPRGDPYGYPLGVVSGVGSGEGGGGGGADGGGGIGLVQGPTLQLRASQETATVGAIHLSTGLATGILRHRSYPHLNGSGSGSGWGRGSGVGRGSGSGQGSLDCVHLLLQ